MADAKDRAFALEMARFYREKGLNPLPSCEHAKKPMIRFAHLWDKMADAELFTDEGFPNTSNLQVLTGRYWRLMVIDLDGGEARDVFRSWCRGRLPRTWTTHRQDGASWHLWFRLPADYPKPLPARFLWKGDGKHEGIERLCDKSLIVAPPSFHVEHTESRYRFIDDARSPMGLGLPVPCPQWLLDRKPIEKEDARPDYVPPPLRPRDPRRRPELRIDRNELLDRLGDKRSIAQEWGIRFTGRVSPDGWAECHAFTRPDAEPSAAMHVQTGVYTDRGEGQKAMPFFDVMIARGLAHDFPDAVDRLSRRI